MGGIDDILDDMDITELDDKKNYQEALDNLDTALAEVVRLGGVCKIPVKQLNEEIEGLLLEHVSEWGE